MTEALLSPGSDPSFNRALTTWRERENAKSSSSGGGDATDDGSRRKMRVYAAYGLAAVLVLGVGATAASLATAPALTDSIDTVAAVDARTMGLAANLDPTGQQSKAATLNRDVGTMKTEIARLQRALDQSRSSQAALSKASAGQAASSQDEVRSLKYEVAGLQKILDATRDSAASKIETLSARVDQSKDDAAHLAELRERLERIERQASGGRGVSAAQILVAPVQTPPVPSAQVLVAPAETASRQPAAEPETTGSISEPKREATTPVVRNWVVREVVRGVALLEGRRGMVEVMRGGRAPGIGRVRSIERRDGQWVVVTDRGLVLERTEL